ncbi:lymphocyte antigen 75 isoform X2 [Narcine bancroftii]|uniref:lymphocyte antigen 75 isoform X2 n=1 Tax=Narcine bancroftii TaxID=1343680 RepID=UPI0038321A01
MNARPVHQSAVGLLARRRGGDRGTGLGVVHILAASQREHRGSCGSCAGMKSWCSGFIHLYWVLVLDPFVGRCAITASQTTDNGIFTIQHQNILKCLTVHSSRIIMDTCNPQEQIQQWKWVSAHRLFNIGAKKCMGLDIINKTEPLKVFECDILGKALWWRCKDGTVHGSTTYKLAVKNGNPTASIDATDTWKQSGSDKDICEQPYREIYTTDGTAYGMPCVFPFKYKNNWYYECTTENYEEEEWCATTGSYDRDKKWGKCLKPDSECKTFWEKDSKGQTCYQFNFQSFLSWTEARLACQNQGGDLLSVPDLQVQKYISEQKYLPKRLWIGLNQLNVAGGWQWSDGTPLVFVNWDDGLLGSFHLEESSCATMNFKPDHWQTSSCAARLPFVCKKPFNQTRLESVDSWKYIRTECEADWLAYNGFCFYMPEKVLNWDDADRSCKSIESDLISIHMLADVELVVTTLHEAVESEVWTGLRSNSFPALFNWSDGSTVTFTYWDRDEPNVPFNTTKHCVSYSGKWGRWKFENCDTKLKYVCKKPGKIRNETSLSDLGCPQNENWERHRNYCYKVDSTEVGFDSKCHLTVKNRFEQEFLNSLMAKHTSESDQYFWLSLEDKNGTGEYTWSTKNNENEPVTYTNWNKFQPGFPGGCVVMAAGKFLGRWEVGNCRTLKAKSICKKRIGNETETEEELPTGPCPSGWHTNTEIHHCYKIFHHERVARKRTWEEAERFCEALGAHLPSFAHNDEMLYLHNLLRKTITNERWFWVGLNKRNPDSKGSWGWSDGRPVSLVVLPVEFKEDDYAIRDCAAFQTQKPLWHTFMIEIRKKFDYHLMPFYCDIKLEWVCQIPKGVKLRTPDWYVPDGQSIHGPTVVIDGNEYWFVNKSLLTYQEANLYCARNDSKLAAVTSKPAIKMIKTHLQKHFPLLPKWWVKTIDYGVMNRYFLSPHDFYHRFLSFHNHYKDCWFITPYYGGWREFHELIDCFKHLPFICQKLNISSLEPWSPETRDHDSPCTGDWIPFGDNCYNFIKLRYLSWEAGQRFCQSLGGNLPTIANSVEQDFIVSRLPSMPKKLWLGMQSTSGIGNNKWVTGRPVDYTNWLSYEMELDLELDLFNIDKRCTILLNEPNTPFIGKWDFVPCDDEQFTVVCQKHQGSVNETATPVLNDTLNFLNHTYIIIKKNLTWEESLTECQKNDYKLVSITDPYHQAFLTVTVNTRGHPMWIGLYSQDDGLHYRWSDGRHATYSHWSTDDPAPTDNCVYMDIDGYWKTLGCDSVLEGVICHIHQKEEEQEMIDRETVRCPHKIQGALWIPFRNNCYSFPIYPGKPSFFQESSFHAMCKNLDPRSKPLTIRSEEENNFIVEQLNIHSYLYKWVWLSVLYNGNRMMWYDGSYVYFSNWRSGRPNFFNSHQNFLGAILDKDGFWYLTSHPFMQTKLILQSVFVCKIENDHDPTHFEPPPDKVPYGNHTYMLIQKKMNWYEALQQCQKSHYQLVSVYEEDQHVFLKSLVKLDGFPLWIGLFSQDGGSSFEWSDGINSDYRPWEYSHLNSKGNCVYMDTKGFWNRTSCKIMGDGAICYASQNGDKSSKHQEKTSNLCPQKNGKSPWIRFKDYCYAFDMGLYNWSIFTMEETKSVCQQLDSSATILSIKDREENDFVTRQIKGEQGITGQVWLGVIENIKDNSLQWLDGSIISYANWINTNLSNSIQDKCAVISSQNGVWILTNCSERHSRLVCKVPIKSNYRVAALVVTVIFILLLICGIVWFLYKKNKWRWANPFGTVHYERSYNDPSDTDSTVMITELKEFHD